MRTLLIPVVAAALLAAIAPSVARADTLALKDGRLVEGLVIPGDGGYYVVSRFGPTFVPADQVQERLRGRSVDAQIQEYLASLGPRDAANRARLAAWMKSIGRDEEARALAEQVLEWDPESAEAHDVLGHVRHRGVWRTPDEAKRLDGFERHGDRWYTPQEWRNVEAAERERAAALEEAAARKRLSEEVNQAIRLILSPDPAVRARGKARLLSLSEEFDSERLRKLLEGIDEYIAQVDELRRKAAALAETDSGMVMGEIRATLTRLKRPIPVFTTNLASGPVGANAPVNIQLPELEVIKVRTTVKMPAAVK